NRRSGWRPGQHGANRLLPADHAAPGYRVSPGWGGRPDRPVCEYRSGPGRLAQNGPDKRGTDGRHDRAARASGAIEVGGAARAAEIESARIPEGIEAGRCLQSATGREDEADGERAADRSS